MAKVSAAIRPSFCATASCLPIGAPHCFRSAAQVRAISSERLAPAAQDAGSVSRPVFSVTSASFRPLPSPQMMFSAGTFTFVKRIRPFSIALSPMKWSRSTTSTPGQSASTMKALIFFPVRAMTTISSAMVPLVHHSFSPFRM